MEILIDLREVAPSEISDVCSSLPDDYKFVITAWQWSRWRRMKGCVSYDRIVVVVPDFLYYARLASTGQAAQIARLPVSLLDVFWSGAVSSPSLLKHIPSLAKGDFWAGAFALLAYDLGLMRGFAGEVVLHSNLCDFVWLFDRRDFLAGYVKAAGKRKPGISTQQLALGLSSCVRWRIMPSRIIYPISAEGSEADLVEFARAHEFSNCTFTADLTMWPEAEVAALLEIQSGRQGSWLVKHCIRDRLRSK